MNRYNELFNSKEWKEFYNYCNIGIFKQINFFRYEDVHTNYLKSLFEEKNVFGLGTRPLELLIELLKKNESSKTHNKLADIDCNKITDVDVNTQIPIDGGRLDLLISFSVSNKKYNIILENKLLSEEHDEQTLNYQKYFEKNNKDIKNIYVYLSLQDDPRLSSDDKEYGNYIKITYQKLIDEVLEECSKTKSNAPISIDEYLKGFTYLCQFDLMPITGRLKELVDDIDKNYSNILYEMIDSLKKDKDKNEYKEELIILYKVLSINNTSIDHQLFNNIGWFKNKENKYGIRQQTKMVLDILKDLFNKRVISLNEIKDFKYNSGWEVIITEDEYNKKTTRRDNFKILDDIKLEDKVLYYSYPVSRDELEWFVDFVKEKYEYTNDDIMLL